MHPPPWRAHLVSLGLRSSLPEGGWGTLLAPFPPFQLESPQVPQRSYPGDSGIATGFSNTSVNASDKKTQIMGSSPSHFHVHNSSSWMGSFTWASHGKQIKQVTGTTRPSPCWPGPHNKELCQPQQHLKPKAEPSPQHFQVELLASLWATPIGSPSSSWGPGTAYSPTVPEVLSQAPHCYPKAWMGPGIFLEEAMDISAVGVSNNMINYMIQAAWRQIRFWHGWQLSLRHNSEAALWSMAIGCNPSFLAAMLCAVLCMRVRE